MFLYFLLTAVFYHSVLASRPTHFQKWYPQFETRFDGILHTNCSEEFDRYMTETPQPGCSNCLAGAVVTCILEAFDENGKAMLATAGVLLGLLPTTLSLVGSSNIETGVLALRRPFLAFLLALGSPAVSPIRTFDYRSPRELLQRSPDNYHVKMVRLSGTMRRVTLSLEYLFTIVAIVNLAHVTWELSLRTVTAVAAVTDYLPILWVATSIIIHMLGAWAVRLRVSIIHVQHGTRTMNPFSQEWQLSAVQPQAMLQLKPENLLFIIISWLASTSTVFHIVFGTLVLAGTLFISPQDAIAVVARYFASTIVCRTILMYEISGMRETIVVESEREPIQFQHDKN